MDDGGVETRRHALVQEHAVEHVAGRGAEAEADVAQSEGGERAGQFGLDATDGLDRGDGVAAQVVVAGGQREGQGVEDEVLRLHAVALGGECEQAVGHPHLPVDVAGLALLVDEQAHHGGAVLPGHAEHPVGP